MTIRLDLNAETPIYQQLRDQLIVGIADGRLLPGESLPSVRQLGADLGINLHTVNKVYNLLRQEGFLSTHRQKGVVVSEAMSRRETDDNRRQLEASLLPILAEARCRDVPLEALVDIVTRQYRSFDRGHPAAAPAENPSKGRPAP